MKDLPADSLPVTNTARLLEPFCLTVDHIEGIDFVKVLNPDIVFYSRGKRLVNFHSRGQLCPSVIGLNPHSDIFVTLVTQNFQVEIWQESTLQLLVS
jgi:hypothetical protein